MKGFTHYLTEAAQREEIVIAIGRFQPPTIGHEKMIETVQKEAKRRKADHMIFPTATHDSKKNPLRFDDKVEVMEEMFPQAEINDDDKLTNIFEILGELAVDYDSVVLVAGQDRVSSFEKMIKPYVKSPESEDFDDSRHVPLENFSTVSAGQRDPDATGVKGMSGTKMRETAENNDFDTFKQGLPKGTKDRTAQKLFQKIREGLRV